MTNLVVCVKLVGQREIEHWCIMNNTSWIILGLIFIPYCLWYGITNNSNFHLVMAIIWGIITIVRVASCKTKTKNAKKNN